MSDYSVEVFSRHHTQFDTSKPGDVGHDLHVHVQDRSLLDHLVSWFVREPVHVILPIIGSRTINSGVHLVMDDEVWCEIRPRSSTSRKKLQVLGGTIDSGYRGELYTVIHNFGLMPKIIRHGERYAQAVFYEAVRPLPIYINEGQLRLRVEAEMEDGRRGMTGFGSTGR